MNAKKLLAALCLLTIMSTASAVVFDVNFNNATQPESKTYYPNLNQADKCIDINFGVYDTNTLAPIHYANIYYNYNTDKNTFIATDLNLSTKNCKFHKTEYDWASGADCVVHYCFNTHNPTTQSYVLDLNVANKTNAGVRDYNANVVRTFSIDNTPFTPTAKTSLLSIPFFLAILVLTSIVGLFVLGKATDANMIAIVVLFAMVVVIISLVIASIVV